MRYFGSKASTLQQLGPLIHAVVPAGSFGDPFGGIGVVGSYFKSQGYTVHTGDVLTVAHQFQVARVVVNEPPVPRRLKRGLGVSTAESVCALLNDAPLVSSFIVREFSDVRPYFTRGNALRIDGARRALGRWIALGWMDPISAAYYRACLIDAVDAVANTAGTYYAYLKTWDRKALRDFEIKPISVTPGAAGCTAVLRDAHRFSISREWDVLYLDPPYNKRNYAAYYHLPETLATGRRAPARGRSGVPARRADISDFARTKKAEPALDRLISKARFRLLALHYSDDGLIPSDSLRRILAKQGKVTEHLLTATGYSSRGSRQVNHRLYLVVR